VVIEPDARRGLSHVSDDHKADVMSRMGIDAGVDEDDDEGGDIEDHELEDEE
jgi:hypothetical protein